MVPDPFNRLVGCCRDAPLYPTKLLRTQLFSHTLRLYHERLNEHERRIFSRITADHEIEFWDYYDDQEEFQSSPCNTIEQLREHLQFHRKDPKCRHVFIQANHSRAPLDCSREMLVFVFSFHQVMAQFLDIVLSFGTFPKRDVPVAFHHSVFRHEQFLDLTESKKARIPELGRSGLEIRHCYNLWSVEKSDSNYGPRWAIRQTAVFHSFDMENGRALWVNMKANALMEERIKESTNTVGYLQPTSSRDLQTLFAATLRTHLIIFEWCDEDWRGYIGTLEVRLEDIHKRANGIPFHKMEDEISERKKQSDEIFNSPPSNPSSSGTNRWNSWGYRKPAWQNLRRSTNSIFGRAGTIRTSTTTEKKFSLDTRSPTLTSPVSENGRDTGLSGPNNDPWSVLHEFKFKELQNLHHIGTKLHETSMVLQLNIQILTDVMEYYQMLVRDSATPEAIRSGYKTIVSSFIQRTNSIVRNLEIERTRISTLMEILENSKALVDAIIQFRNMEISQRSSMRMELMTQDMHQIAEKTEKETSSMHIITLVTLVFLPGTFVAVRYDLSILKKAGTAQTANSQQTFLGSGLFQWGNGDGDEIPDMPLWRPHYFALFALICFPLMGVTIVTWYFWSRLPCRNWFYRGHGREGDEESASGEVQNKAIRGDSQDKA